MGVTVFLLDDHEVVRRGLRELLEFEPDMEVVGESGSAVEAARRIPALRPDVMVLDARLPDGSGIDVCREVRSVDPTIRAIILTSYDDEQALTAAVTAGASGYVLKDVRGSDLVQSIRRVAAGESLLAPDVVERLRRAWGHEQPTDPRLAALTPQERRILDCIAQGMTNRQIGDSLSLAEKTVKNYVTSVLAKLGMERRTQAAVYVAGQAAGNTAAHTPGH
jgi:DNA-binding NarL/FixJ family response regulator